jgi:Mn-containing catalase
VKEALGFLMTREIAHQKSFEKALYSIRPNFPPGKLPGDPRFSKVYVNLSQGLGEQTGPWNDGKQWERLDGADALTPVDGGDGQATVELNAEEQAMLDQMAARTASAQDGEPLTGAEIGSAEQDVNSKTRKP